MTEKRLKSTKQKIENPNAHKHPVTLRLSAVELEQIKENAELYTEGNISEWLRYAALNFKPGKGDFEK